MNRPIKFRAWDTHEKRFIETWVMDNKDVFHNGTDYEDCIPQLDLELQQWTGLTDKNGKEIYEGDIVFFDFSHSQLKRVCEWDAARCGFTFGGYFYNIQEFREQGEIIGNIYENPDLLALHDKE